mgnify:CR=1 FL=1
MEQKPLLSVESLGVERDGKVLLDGVDWEVLPERHWVVLGPNGSGKTTLLKILAGMMAPTRGTVRLFGKQYGRTDWNLLRRRIGMVSHSLGTRIEGYEEARDVLVSGKYGQINFWGKSSQADRRQAERLLEEIGLAGKGNQTWETLSQGERQRVLIGRALMRNVKLLVLDEPCAGLDPIAREAFLAFLNRILKEKRTPTCILVTHHVEEILPVFHGVLCLNRGKSVAVGKRLDVMRPAILGRTYGCRVRLKREAGRFWMKVSAGQFDLFQP